MNEHKKLKNLKCKIKCLFQIKQLFPKNIIYSQRITV